MLATRDLSLRLPPFAPAIALFVVKLGFLAAAAGLLFSLVSPEPESPESIPLPHAQPALVAIEPFGPVLRVQAPEPIAAAPAPPPPAEPSPPAIASLFEDEPAGCRVPVEDTSVIQVGDRMLSARTHQMLRHAAELYGGPIDLAGAAILAMPPVDKHREGPDPHHDRGVVDISVRDPDTGRILYHEIDAIVSALRVAGMAAWLRDANELYPGSDIHIHAVAIGDAALSAAAIAQLNGKYGYFAGRKGYFDPYGTADPHGGPVLCGWMIAAGYADPADSVSAGFGRAEGWQERLRTAAESFITTSRYETYLVARALDFAESGFEDPSNMCGPLSAAILQRAGLLPGAGGPITDLSNYWLADPLTNGRPWSLFPSQSYQVHRSRQSIGQFDFTSWPLYPGDFVYTYSGNGAFSHMFVVTEVDDLGRAYTVTNNQQPNGDYLIERVLLYDPLDPEAGVLRSSCRDCGSWRRRTGLGGFDVLRRRDPELLASAGGEPAGLPIAVSFLQMLSP